MDVFRIFIAFFLQGITYTVLLSLSLPEIFGPLFDLLVALGLAYFILFVPNIVYSVGIEILQKYIRSYILFGFISAFLGIIILLLFEYFTCKVSKNSAFIESLIAYFITYLIVSIYLKYLYNRSIN